MYEVQDLAIDLAEADDFKEELQPLLDQLESSQGTVILEELPLLPCESLGLRLENLGDGVWVISYDLKKFALVAIENLWWSTCVGESLRRWLDNVEPTSEEVFIEKELYGRLLT